VSLAYIVLEAGPGWMGAKAFTAGTGPDSLGGVDDAPPYSYPLTTLKGASHAVASSAGMDGVEGGWPILYGASAVTPGALRLAIEEDWWFDPERSHPTEQAAYIVFGSRGGSCGIGFELVFLTPLLAALQRRRLRRRCAG
jgi:hypothetical protein